MAGRIELRFSDVIDMIAGNGLAGTATINLRVRWNFKHKEIFYTSNLKISAKRVGGLWSDGDGIGIAMCVDVTGLF